MCTKWGDSCIFQTAYMQEQDPSASNRVCCIFSLIALSFSLLPGFLSSYVHTHKDTRTHTCAHTRPTRNVSQYFTFSSLKCQCLGQSLSAFLVSPTSLAFCLCASHLNLLSLPDISHARGSQDKLNISKVCHKRLEVHYGMKVIKYKQHFVVS